MKMESFYIIANAGRDTELKVTGKVEDFLRSQGKSVRSHCYSRYVNGIYTDEDAIPEDTDCVIVIGGDGTLIQAAHDIADRELPLLGINLGKLGFLADVEPDDIEASLTALVEGRFKIDDRMMPIIILGTAILMAAVVVAFSVSYGLSMLDKQRPRPAIAIVAMVCALTLALVFVLGVFRDTENIIWPTWTMVFMGIAFIFTFTTHLEDLWPCNTK